MLDNIQLLFVWAPIINVQVILEGIFLGAVFALSAYGLALVWGVMNIKNLAQGDFVIMGGYLSFALGTYKIPLYIVLPLVMVIMLMVFLGGRVSLQVGRWFKCMMMVPMVITFRETQLGPVLYQM